MHGNEIQFLKSISGFLGSFFLILCMMNAIGAFYCWKKLKDAKTFCIVCLGFALLFLIMSPLGYSGINGNPEMMKVIGVPEGVRAVIDKTMGNAVIYTIGTSLMLVVLYFGREFFVKPLVAWIGLNLSFMFMGMSMIDQEFAAIVGKPDNVPIVMMVYLLGYFTWLSASQAVKNDNRKEQGLPPLEKVDDEKILVWPDLVYTEMICMVVMTAVLIFWGIALQAPLEEPGSLVKTPNPSKAPWYFLGLQEMLVYFDPWMAGVVLPSLVVGGLMAIPFLDFNKAGNGYYTIKERTFAYSIFQIGFIELWVVLIVLGTFLRGPNWNLFGPYEYWDAHKVEALNNVDLSQMFWVNLMQGGMPKAADDASTAAKIGMIIYRELPGIIVTAAYFVVLPPIMALTFLKKYFVRMGFIRFMVMTNLLLFMALLPIKMVLRWSFNLKYLIAIPEYLLNL